MSHHPRLHGDRWARGLWWCSKHRTFSEFSD